MFKICNIVVHVFRYELRLQYGKYNSMQVVIFVSLRAYLENITDPFQLAIMLLNSHRPHKFIISV